MPQAQPQVREAGRAVSPRRSLPGSSGHLVAGFPITGTSAPTTTRLAFALLVAVVVFCSCLLARATEPNGPFKVDVFGTAQGLPSSAVLALTQTRDGYLWVGTLAGLARFDGARFEVFDENNTPGLTSSQIRRLYEDRQGNLWIGTENGSVVTVNSGKLTSVDISQRGPPGRLMSICEDTNGAVILYTDNGVLARYRAGKVDVWVAGTGAPSTCYALAAEDSGLLWVGTDTSLAALNPIPVPAEPPISIRLNFLLPSKRGGHWRLADGRVQKYVGIGLQLDLGPYPWTNTLPIVAACEDQDGNLVVGTYGDGVYWFGSDGKATRISMDDGMSNNSVLALAVDREGCLWVGTNGGGLNRVRRKLFDVLNRSRGSVVQSVCEDDQGGLWIGYNENRVDYHMGADTRSFELIDSSWPWSANPNTLVNAKAVFVGHKQGEFGGRWVLTGTWGGRLDRQFFPVDVHLFQLEYPRFTSVPLPEGLNSMISAIFQDRSGRLWLGTQSGLLDFFALRLFTIRDGLSGNDVRAIAEDREGNLWIGTEGGGLNRLRDGHFTCYTRTNGLPGNTVRAAELDADGVLWVATSGGLARFKGSRWTHYAKKEGLASNDLGYLLEDGHGYLWIGSNAGLMRLKKDELNRFAEDSTTLISCRVYAEADGLPATECTGGSQPGACRAKDGTLWFPTIQGLAWVNPTHLNLNTNPPPVVIESVLVDGQVQNPAQLRAGSPQAVTIPARKEGLEIRYASLNLAAPDKGRFKFQLEGYETTPKERPGNVREVLYSKIPPGEYHFKVTACNEDGVWNPSCAALAVTVLPPFWQTWWFLGLTSATLLGMIVGSVHYVSTQRLQRQLAALRQKEALEKERARIARDIHDQVGASLTQLSLLGELVEGDKNHPEEVEGHARQIEQTALETTRALDEIVWTVNPSNDTLDGLINYVCKYAQDYLAVAGLRYRLEAPPQLPGTPITPELRHNVFLASKEAITNVVRHAQATAVSLRLHLEPASFTLEIEDNGCGLGGLDPKAAQTRNGLRNMRKRMEDIGGNFYMGPGPERGAVIRLTAPLKKE